MFSRHEAAQQSFTDAKPTASSDVSANHAGSDPGKASAAAGQGPSSKVANLQGNDKDPGSADSTLVKRAAGLLSEAVKTSPVFAAGSKACTKETTANRAEQMPVRGKKQRQLIQSKSRSASPVEGSSRPAATPAVASASGNCIDVSSPAAEGPDKAVSESQDHEAQFGRSQDLQSGRSDRKWRRQSSKEDSGPVIDLTDV